MGFVGVGSVQGDWTLGLSVGFVGVGSEEGDWILGVSVGFVGVGSKEGRCALAVSVYSVDDSGSVAIEALRCVGVNGDFSTRGATFLLLLMKESMELTLLDLP